MHELWLCCSTTTIAVYSLILAHICSGTLLDEISTGIKIFSSLYTVYITNQSSQVAVQLYLVHVICNGILTNYVYCIFIIQFVTLVCMYVHVQYGSINKRRGSSTMIAVS